MNPGDAGRAPTPDDPGGGATTAGPASTKDYAAASGGCPTFPARRRRVLPGLACAALCFAAAVGSQLGADRARAADRGGSVLYLPNEMLLKHATAGLNTIIADFLWLHCIQYVAIENTTTRNFTWLETMARTTVRLDPHFKDAYRYGAIFLSALKADAEASSRLLCMGIPENPRAWELPYEMGMNYLMNRREEPDARRYAAYYLGMSAATGRSPQFVAITAAKLQSEQNLDTVEQDMWLQMLESPDKLMRDLAERKLREMQIKEVIPLLDQAAGIYRDKTGRWPESIEDLQREKIVQGPPPDPVGGRYFFGSDGKAYSTTLLDNQKSVMQGIIEQAIRDYQDSKSQTPQSLETLVQEGLLTAIPPNPYPGKSWTYDPATGTVE